MGLRSATVGLVLLFIIIAVGRTLDNRFGWLAKFRSRQPRTPNPESDAEPKEYDYEYEARKDGYK